ncbi:hypothetical protein BH24ACT26_BH24ACT26_04100 [soil metagenome]
MDLYLLSYQILKHRYQVPAEAVAEAIIDRRHGDGVARLLLTPTVLEPERPDVVDPSRPRPSVRS